MGYVMSVGTCFGCNRVFSFNPMRVPSYPHPERGRLPICQECVARVNPMRKANGLPPIVPHADAYEPCEESELHD